MSTQIPTVVPTPGILVAAAPEWIEHWSCVYKFPWECNVQLALVLCSADKKFMAYH